MSDVQRFFPGDDGVLHPLGADEFPGHGYMSVADHERVVAELREAHEKALAEARRIAAYTSGIAVDDREYDEVLAMMRDTQQYDYDRGHVAGVNDSKPHALTADDPEPGVGSVVLDGFGNAWRRYRTGWRYTASVEQGWRYVGGEFTGPVRLIHDSGKEK